MRSSTWFITLFTPRLGAKRFYLDTTYSDANSPLARQANGDGGSEHYARALNWVRDDKLEDKICCAHNGDCDEYRARRFFAMMQPGFVRNFLL